MGIPQKPVGHALHITTGNDRHEIAVKESLPKTPAIPRRRQIGLSRSTKSLHGQAFVSPLKANGTALCGMIDATDCGRSEEKMAPLNTIED
ncbi:hypothetical protein QFC21_000328 [Naganishia friedmannii]|uniref:Uncharacterized protein n=1 Tax=Naganishia friedmannii TaxID=89922 RepID=A0ACC2WD56_9TREE|nr:hypothetical protein QFC21_000328 [Naganishia friedmannii]